MIKKILVCGTRKKGYDSTVRIILNEIHFRDGKNLEIVEGCCPDSADEYAERWAADNSIVTHHFPASQGSYLKRNIEMVKFCDEVIAFWDEFSYGTAHAIATAVKIGKSVRIISLK